MQLWKLGVIFSIVSIILLSIALVLPWYHISSSFEIPLADEPSESTSEFSLQEVTSRSEFLGEEEEDTTKYTDEDIEDLKYIAVYNYTYYTMLIALVMTILLLVFSILAGLKGGKMLNVGIIVGLLALMFALIAPLYFMGMLPIAFGEGWDDIDDEFEDAEKPGMMESFFGEDSHEEEGYESKISWGGTTGWFLAITAAVFNAIAFAALVVFWRRPESDEPQMSPRIFGCGIGAAIVVGVVFLALLLSVEGDSIYEGFGDDYEDIRLPPPDGGNGYYDNYPPIARFNADRSTAQVNEPINFDASGSGDPDGEIEYYYWEFGDGCPEGGENLTYIQHSYVARGDYLVNLTVRDNDGDSSSTSTTIHVTPENYQDSGSMLLLERDESYKNDSVSFPVEDEAIICNISLTFSALSFENGVDNAEFEVFVYNPDNELLYRVDIMVSGRSSASFTLGRSDLKIDGDYELEIDCSAGGGYINYDIEVLYHY